MSRATLDKDPREVASMFDGVARRYDLTNTVLSLGQDRYWRRATRLALSIGSGEKVLDLAAGTAVSTVELASSGAWCVATDFSVGMLAAGHARIVPKVAGDATRLPFGDNVFDAVTISFGLRNIADRDAADLLAIQDQEDVAIRAEDLAAGIAGRVGRAARPGVDLDLAVDEVDDPIRRDARAGIDPSLGGAVVAQG